MSAVVPLPADRGTITIWQRAAALTAWLDTASPPLPPAHLAAARVRKLAVICSTRGGAR